MKVVGRILVVLAMMLGVGVGVAYLDGMTLPANHSISVKGVVPAPPDQVFARISDVAHATTWRPAVKSVTMLPPENGPGGPRDHWVEDLGHGTKMPFLATRSDAPARREVLLDDHSASYGGTWVYELGPGPSPGTTSLRITEIGYIRPPVFRFIVAHVLGMTRNQDVYMSDLKSSFSRH